MTTLPCQPSALQEFVLLSPSLHRGRTRPPHPASLPHPGGQHGGCLHWKPSSPLGAGPRTCSGCPCGPAYPLVHHGRRHIGPGVSVLGQEGSGYKMGQKGSPETRNIPLQTTEDVVWGANKCGWFIRRHLLAQAGNLITRNKEKIHSLRLSFNPSEPRSLVQWPRATHGCLHSN